MLHCSVFLLVIFFMPLTIIFPHCAVSEGKSLPTLLVGYLVGVGSCSSNNWFLSFGHGSTGLGMEGAHSFEHGGYMLDTTMQKADIWLCSLSLRKEFALVNRCHVPVFSLCTLSHFAHYTFIRCMKCCVVFCKSG